MICPLEVPFFCVPKQSLPKVPIFETKKMVPAASSKSEWVFSVAGNVVTPKRASLNPEKVKDLVVVKCNLRLLKGMGFIRK